MKPSAAAVLSLLRARPEGLTFLECLYAGCGSRLSGRVHELRAEGFDVTSTYETTDNGARIVRYRLRESECGAVVEACHCVMRGQHIDHVCQCGGAWRGPADQFEVLAFPGGYPASLDGMLSTLDNIIDRIVGAHL